MCSFDRVLPVSQAMADVARRAGIPEERITVVHDGIDREKFLSRLRRDRKEVRAELGLTDEHFVVIQVAHLRAWKGHDLVLDALPMMDPTARKDLRLLVVGAAAAKDQVYADHLHKKTAALGLKEHVRFLGGRGDVPDLIRASDLLLHASTAPEPFELVLLEAMVLGVPVLASAAGGPREILSGETGALFGNQPSELQRILQHLVSNPNLLARVAESTCARASLFTIDSTTSRIAGLLTTVPLRTIHF